MAAPALSTCGRRNRDPALCDVPAARPPRSTGWFPLPIGSTAELLHASATPVLSPARPAKDLCQIGRRTPHHQGRDGIMLRRRQRTRAVVNPTLVEGDMRYWRMQPDARLLPWVLCYYLVEPTSGTPLSPSGQQLLLPDGHSELVFQLEAPFERWVVGEPAKRAVMKSSYLIGGRFRSVLTRNLGRVRVAGVKLDSRLLHAIIRMPLSEFRDSTLALDELDTAALLDLDDEVKNARSAEQVKGLLDRFFLWALGCQWPGEPAIDGLLQRIHLSRGSLSIMQWTRNEHINSRTLERRFCAWMGMTPKQYSRIVRFKHSYHRFVLPDAGALGTHLDAYY